MSDDNLSRMGTAKVRLLVDDAGNQVIEKFPVNDVEFSFYQHAARHLAQVGISTPKLLFADPSMRKLRLEYIPHQVDQDDVARDGVLEILSRLHSYPPDSSWVYHNHTWSEVALEKSLILLALPGRAAKQLRYFQQASDALFSGHFLISGDSNAGNWGKREHGDLVLFDWERFSTGSPAIDLAPLIKGMGSKQKFIEFAERYNCISRNYNLTDLAKEIAIAKAWIVTEVVILLNERQKSDFQFYLNWYREYLPAWLDDTLKML
ncbi:aminoglycoside phosphotransferase [Scandinavium goeteborgense]|uniref:phosphotransferase family protein n=1 Tax=Scandinavium goeteborgense TaxID=1851514 RepID=UPI002166AB61|nr:aminoglycoside phosphotransferase [Scandinavium goeteborgense]MCS2154396.1 aminoglycoside phosphotransferase [Scandinavium goeteborgense]